MGSGVHRRRNLPRCHPGAALASATGVEVLDAPVGSAVGPSVDSSADTDPFPFDGQEEIFPEIFLCPHVQFHPSSPPLRLHHHSMRRCRRRNCPRHRRCRRNRQRRRNG